MSEKIKLYEERLQRFTNAVELKANDRVPIISNIDNWALFNYGTTLKQARMDMEVEYAAFAKANTEAYFDVISYPGIASALNFIISLGGGIYQENTETIQVATGQSEIMNVEEYDQLINDPKSFFLNVILPRKTGILQRRHRTEKI